MSSDTPRLIALLSGPDQKGLVAKVSGWIYEHDGNIIHADQHRDQEEGVFFQRVEWAVGGSRSADAEADAFRAFGDSIGMRTKVALSGFQPKVALFVSKADHCFHDLVLRWKAGDFPCEIGVVVSNHESLKAESEGYGIPFEYVPVTKETKPDAEAKQLALLNSYGIDLVIMARYMQVLSAIFLDTLGRPSSSKRWYQDGTRRGSFLV